MSSGTSYHEQLSRQDRTFGQGRPTTPLASTSPSTASRRQQDARDSLEDGVPERRYQTSTCPSTHSLSPLAPEQSSRALLSKFLSRPDDDTQSSPWRGEIGRRQSTNYSITPHLSPENRNFTSAETSSRQLSFEPTHVVGLRIDSPRLSSSHHFQPENFHKMIPDGPSGREPQEPSLETQAFVKDEFRSSRQDPIPSTSKNPRPSFSSNRFDGDEFRCRDCNRKCKSQMSYEKHKASCTHRQGPLTLECRYCKRPYTYIGYLSKHEIECAKFHR